MAVNRKPYIDIAKGIGIYFVVLVHLTQKGSLLSRLDLAFCVAFFFIVSGMLFNPSNSFKQQMNKLINRIIVPLLLYGVIDAVIKILWIVLIKHFSIHELIKIILKVFFVSGSANLNGPLWYLQSLACIQIIMWILISISKKLQKFYVPLNIFFFTFFLVMAYFIRNKLPFRIGQIPSALVLFMIGYHLKILLNIFDRLKHKLLPATILMGAFLLISYVNGFAELAERNFGNYYILFYSGALCATLSILLFAMYIKKNKILEFYGKNSLIIMCIHFYFAQYIIPWLFSCFGIVWLL